MKTCVVATLWFRSPSVAILRVCVRANAFMLVLARALDRAVQLVALPVTTSTCHESLDPVWRCFVAFPVVPLPTDRVKVRHLLTTALLQLLLYLLRR